MSETRVELLRVRAAIVASIVITSVVIPVPPASAAAGWTQQSPIVRPGNRWGAASAEDPNNSQVVVFGGCIDEMDPVVFCPGPDLTHPNGYVDSETWVWVASSWTLKATIGPSARQGSSMSYDPDSGDIILFGGFRPGDAAPLGDTWRWDGLTWTQVTTSNAPTARIWAGMAAYMDSSNNYILLFGGCTSVVGTANQDCDGFNSDTWKFDNGSWTQVCTSSCTPPSARMVGKQMTRQDDGTVLLYGGYYNGGTPTYYGETFKWTGSAWSDVSPGSGNPDRKYGGGMAKIYHSGAWKVLLYAGGKNPNGLDNDSWLWNGSSWSQFGSGNPGARQSFVIGATNDSSTTVKVLIFSGVGNGPAYPDLGGTWLFSGS